MNLEILTPEEKVYNGEVSSVQLPGSKGSFEVLNNHAPLISSLEGGKINVKGDNVQEQFEIKSGFVEVLNNQIIVLIEGLISEE